MKVCSLVVALLAIWAVDASAMIVSLVGDKDGFGGRVADAVPVDGTDIVQGAVFDNRTADDPLFTDSLGYEQRDPEFESPLSYQHEYTLNDAAISASLVIQEAGMGDSRGIWDVLFNGDIIGSIGAIGKSGRDSFLHTFQVPIGLLTGDDTVTLDYQSDLPEGYAINFSELTIETQSAGAVPEPTSFVVWAVMLGGIGLIRRRNK